VLAATQEKRSGQEQMRLKLETERLNFEKKRAEAHDRNAEKRLDIMAAQADLQRQQQSPSARMMFASGVKVCIPLTSYCLKAVKSKVADNKGYGKNEKTRYGCT
jgi:hypothetical protein